MNTDHRQVWIILGVLVVVLLGSFLVGGMMGLGMMWGFGGPGIIFHGSGWLWGLDMGLGGLVMLALWGALIAGGILLVRWLLGYTHAGDDRGGDDALAILRRSDAAGESDRATYEQMMRDLTGATRWASDLTYGARTTDGQSEERPVLSSSGRPESP